MRTNSLLARTGFWLCAAVAALAGPARAETAAVCDGAQACIALLRELAARDDNSAGLNRDEQALVARLQQLQPDVVPALVDLLADPAEPVAELAAVVLRDVERIDARYWPQIRAGLDRDLGWLPPVLCGFSGEEPAREAVARFLVSKGAPHNQHGAAVQRCGRRAIPYIVEAARCVGGCAPQVLALGSVLSDMGDAGAAAAPGLLAIAIDPGTPRASATIAIELIGELQIEPAAVEQPLLELRRRRTELAGDVDATLVGIGSTVAGRILADRLVREPDERTLNELAAVGASGAAAGPVVLGLLQHADWDVRLAAARTLGYIGFRDATPALIRLLADPEDVRLTWVAAESLGRLQADAAIDALRVTAQSHWYPPVRESAARALEHIEQRTPYEGSDYRSMSDGQTTCTRPLVTQKQEPAETKLRAGVRPELRATLAYVVDEETYTIEKSDRTAVRDPSGRVVGHRPTKVRRTVERKPDVALRVDGGWIAGRDSGEWGGELVFVGDDGSAVVLLDDNVENVYALGDRVVALVGLSHMGTNRGMAVAVTRGSDGKWIARPWRALPGAPKGSFPTDTGEVLVNVAGGGTLLLHPNGTLRVAPCGDS